MLGCWNEERRNAGIEDISIIVEPRTGNAERTTLTIEQHNMRKLIYILIILVLLAWHPVRASADSIDDGTMLLFVGENIELLTIASRREETPARAPAVVRVISREEFLQKGHNTVSSILRQTPGFHMARKEWGHTPYLRGMPDSVMFLYDTVPLGSELSKSLHPIDHELSLAPVRQVEIVRGPSSVLWGPDAFAGVVNIVPLTGRDFQGAEAGVSYGEPGLRRGAYLNLGRDFGAWDGFVSLSIRQQEEDRNRANVKSFFDYDGSRPVPAALRAGGKNPGDARYLDGYASVNLGRKISLSGRFSDNFHPYSVKRHGDEVRWIESRSLPFGYVKLDANHDMNLETKVRFTGYYSRMNPEYELIDKKYKQKDETCYLEALADRSFFSGQGLLTAGLSFKHKDIADAPIWDNYYPGFLGPENESFLPNLTTRDFSNQVWSPFAQYSHKFGDFDLMLGIRQDFHQKYKNNLSYNSSLVWTPLEPWTFKLLYGTAYRTPFARQLLDEKKPDMEKSENLSLQVGWNSGRDFSLTGTVFYNRLSNHRMENLLAASQAKSNPNEFYGLSSPNSQDIYGLELEAFYSPVSSLDLEAGLTLLKNRGSDERYRYVKYSYIRPDGKIIDVYGEMKFPFDPGPKVMLDFMATWKASNRLTFFSHLEYFSSRKLISSGAGEKDFQKASDVWLLHAGATLKDSFTEGLDLSVKFRNITDNRYRTPGTYSMMKDRGFSGELSFRYVF